MILYSREGCAPCVALKKWLNHKKIQYEVKDVDEAGVLDELIKLTGQMSVPVVKIDNRVVVGLDYGSIMKTQLL